MKLRWSALTDVGRVRDHNEDIFVAGEPPAADAAGQLLVVCDGMGGHAAGEVASKLAAETILAAFYAADPAADRASVLRQAFVSANEQVFAHGRGRMGTTGVAGVLHHDALLVANVGDSRAYLVRAGQARQISRDHSFVSDQVAAGLITEDEARVSPVRNVITRAIGHQADVDVDLFRQPLQIGDRLLLASDGLHGLVTDAELAHFAQLDPLDDAVVALVNLANERGGSDNITVVLAVVDALDWEQELLPQDAPTQPALSALPPSITQPAAPRPAPLPLPSAVEPLAPVTLRPVGKPPAPPKEPRRRTALRVGSLLVFLIALALILYPPASRYLLTLANPAVVTPAPAATVPAATPTLALATTPAQLTPTRGLTATLTAVPLGPTTTP